MHFLHHWWRGQKNRGQIAFPGRDIPGLIEELRKIRELEKPLRDAELELQYPIKAILPDLLWVVVAIKSLAQEETEARDTELYAQILGLKAPWFVEKSTLTDF